MAADGSPNAWTVVDLFSGAGGASYGFKAHSGFDVIGAADVELGKPSTGHGALDCNGTYLQNIGIDPVAVDLGVIEPSALANRMGVKSPISVLVACPPCTGFSRTNAKNHVHDDPRNSLVAKVADFVEHFQPQVVFLENARELLSGRFTHHFAQFSERLQGQGYTIRAEVHMLTRFGLPQQRERSIVIAVKEGLPLPGLADLWEGYSIDEKSTHVRRAIWDLPPIESGQVHPDDPAHTSTFFEGTSLQRIKAIPQNGGSWGDLLADPTKKKYLIPAMLRAADRGRLNQFCDVYGRMAWDRPAPTIKRECSHVGNGRYLHPEQNRLCTVREMAVLQGFPLNYRFSAKSRKNAYRNI
jgi:DNA (cytosine-5)-methyltransferase 1